MSHKIDAALNHRASISERVQRLRAQLLSARPEVFDERGLLITDAYREALNESAQMRRAKALDRILRKVHIQIKPDELIVGCKVPQPKGSPVYPEFNVQWLEDELDTLARREETPYGAVTFVSGRRQYDRSRCRGCGLCVQACASGGGAFSGKGDAGGKL